MQGLADQSQELDLDPQTNGEPQKVFKQSETGMTILVAVGNDE